MIPFPVHIKYGKSMLKHAMNSFVLASILEKTDVKHSFRIVLHWTNTLSSAYIITCGLPYITSMYSYAL